MGMLISMGMGEIHRIAQWRARRAARHDVPMDAPPFALEEPCPGCGERRVATMVWRSESGDAPPVALPRMAPHFLCRDGEVVCQEVTDAGIPLAGWTRILGHFEEAASGA
jgi:hypothetical protein